jgi:uncharacterized protein (DUF983 family)
MLIEMTETPRMTASRNVYQSLMRGLRGKCPACGEGELSARYLKIADHCPKCGEELFHQRADDAPPYVTIFIVGHIVVPLLMLVERNWSPEPWVHLVLWGPLTLLLTLVILPRIKGAFVGLQWALRMHGFGDETVAERQQARWQPEQP